MRETVVVPAGLVLDGADRQAALAGEFDWDLAVGEIAPALTLTRREAERLLRLAWDAWRRLPEVGGAMLAGHLDQCRAAVFCEKLARLEDLELARSLVGQILPVRPP
jgi:hypothetical protein